jgi:hypothetical protein
MNKPLSPSPYCSNPQKVKAIVLGADPSNFSDNGERKILTKAFGIGDGDKRYFQGILTNLNAVGLILEDIYVDNLIQDYLPSETSNNKEWELIAKINIPLCLERLDIIDKERRIPILITAEIILKTLLNNVSLLKRPKEYYSNPALIPIKPNDNELFRPLIPFYRHLNYKLSKHVEYQKRIIKILENKNE